MRSRQIYASLTATSTGTLYFDMPDSSTIRGVNFAVTPSVAGANGDYIEAEISLSSSNQTAVNDAQAVVAAASFAALGTGTVASMAACSFNVASPANCPVKKGERVYLNVTEVGTTTWRVRAIVWFD
jgi:hypothetical protein